ncbi:MAG: Lipopolysaccharide export system ATP-binding protein LptB [Alphaproteobacteria bacterium MarineAlpha5_Bin9]|nr:MAG: Lipopolysaccharide export system ATP-binding protein LptB [Alphaproteobacteria bacterium MarineAlpha5_Bin9]
MLEVKNIDKFFGGIHAVNNVSLKVEKGSITGLIGPNGAGKTTLFNIIAGNIKSSSGKVELSNENITNLEAHELFSKGVLRTFQIAHEFSTLTVLENLMMVPGSQYGEKIIYNWINSNIVKKQEEEIRAKAIEVIKFLNLSHLTQEIAGNLSGGQKKLLELGRTMMVDAKIVLLDEVGAGVNRTLLNDISEAIIRLNKEKNYTFFVIEHDMELIEKLCEPVIVMAEGSLLFQGNFNEVKSNNSVIEAYLGKGIKNKEKL